MNRQGIVVLGSANVDLVVDVDRRPAAGETVIGSDLVTTAGGKGANQAVAAGLLGGSVTFVGCVGDDEPGALLRSSLAAAGVDTAEVQTADTPTGTAIIVVTPDGDNSIVVAPGANRRMTPAAAQASRPRWSGASILVLQLEVPLETVDTVAQAAAAAGTRVVLNAAPAGPLDAATLAVCDPLVVNESEAASLVGGEATLATGPSVVGDLLALGARSVVVTLGGSGALLASAEAPDVVHVPALDVAAVDTTGAGDAFVGAVAVALAEGEELEVAVRWATRAAAHSVQRRGAQTSYPVRADLPELSSVRAPWADDTPVRADPTTT